MKKIRIGHALSVDDKAVLFSRLCDTLCRELWADRYGILPDDGIEHTSDEARRVAMAIFDRLGLWEDGYSRS